MNDLYRDIILDHYKHPRHFGTLEHPDVSSEAYNATCGDKIRMEIKTDMDGNVAGIAFSGQGCAISMAAASMLTEAVAGKPVTEIMKLTADDVMALLATDLTPSRVKCAVLPLEVLQQAAGKKRA